MGVYKIFERFYKCYHAYHCVERAITGVLETSRYCCDIELGVLHTGYLGVTLQSVSLCASKIHFSTDDDRKSSVGDKISRIIWQLRASICRCSRC